MDRFLHLFPQKIHTLQRLSAAAINVRETFANTMLQQLDADEIAVENTWLSDEAFFSLEDFVKKQNWIISGTDSSYGRTCLHRKSWFGPQYSLEELFDHFSVAKD